MACEKEDNPLGSMVQLLTGGSGEEDRFREALEPLPLVNAAMLPQRQRHPRAERFERSPGRNGHSKQSRKRSEGLVGGPGRVPRGLYPKTVARLLNTERSQGL